MEKKKINLERLIRKTKSPCPVCKRVLDADIVVSDGKVRMIKHCPDHKGFDLVMSNYPDFFEQVAAMTNAPPDVPDTSENFDDFGNLRGICLDITQRCNLSCSNCFSQANESIKPDFSAAEISKAMDKITGRPPVVFLQGGEPTLHEELPDIIADLVRRKCVPKLVTNGMNLTDVKYVKTLKDAGLEWIFFQFDGFDDLTYQAFRGWPLTKIKMKALNNVTYLGFSILLAMMVERDYNLHEIGTVLEFAFHNPQVRQISFLPGSRVGRNHLTDDESRTEPVDVIDAIDQATKGGVTRKDFLSFFKIAKVLNKITGNPDYKPKSCFFPIVLYRKMGNVYGLNRVLNPLFASKHPRAVEAAFKLVTNVRRLDNAPKDNSTLWICIEHFRELATLDMEDAKHCNKVFLDEKGRYIQSCLYNNLYRGEDK